MMLTQKKKRHKQRGVALIETAFLLPILFLLLFMVVDFGRAFHHMIAVTNAARTGAVYGAQSPAHAIDKDNIELAAKQNNDEFKVTSRRYCHCPEESAEGDCSPDTCSGNAEMYVEVTVEREFGLFSGMLPLPDILNLSQTSTFRVQ